MKKRVAAYSVWLFFLLLCLPVMTGKLVNATELEKGSLETDGDLPLYASEQETEESSLDLDLMFPDVLPDQWYAGDEGRKPQVRSQGVYGTCWALTAVSALETALLPDREIVFSAEHLVLNNGFTADLNDGGDYRMIMAYLSSWQGPVTEAEDPYGDAYSPSGLSPAVHVQEIQVHEGADRDWIKEMVYRYGSVQTSLFMSRATTSAAQNYYNESSAAYYYPEQETRNHDVLILGWDDTYSRFNFRQVPDVDGAYICQNTWGEDFGQDGIFYVSYADPNIGSINTVYTRIDDTDNYDRIYQTDTCGWQGSQGYDDEMCWFANVYQTDGAENLMAAGFYATAPDTSYEIYLVREFADSSDFDRREYLQGGTLPNIGYYTIDLETPVSLAPGERFAIVVQMTAPGRINPVAVEYRANEYTQNVTTEGKEGYLSQDGMRWQNTEEKFGTNVCLKVYTADR